MKMAAPVGADDFAGLRFPGRWPGLLELMGRWPEKREEGRILCRVHPDHVTPCLDSG